MLADLRIAVVPYSRRADAMEQATTNYLSTLELGELQQHDNMAVWPYGFHLPHAVEIGVDRMYGAVMGRE